MSKEIREIPYHLYLGSECMAVIGDELAPVGKLRGITDSETEPGKVVAICGDTFSEFYIEEVKPILRKLSSMTEEEFHGLAQSFFNDEKLTFGKDSTYWYACTREIDPEYEGEVIEHINEACDDDPENVIMCCIRSKAITYGWIEYDEKYHGFSTTEQAEVFQYLLSKGFDLFNLIPEGLALDSDSKA
jgi:hypothetical protein